MPTVAEIADQIKDLEERISVVFRSHGWAIETPLNQINNYLPPFPITHLFSYIDYTSQRVRELTSDDLKKSGLNKFLADLPTTLTAMQFSHFANDPDAVFGGWMSALQLINARLPAEAKGPVKLDWQSVTEKTLMPKDLAQRLRSLEARLTALEPRSMEVENKITDIEAAHAAAEQLPEDLAELAAKRDKVQEIAETVQALLDDSSNAAVAIENLRDQSVEARRGISDSEDMAKKLITRSEQALRGSTGVGLAKSFESRQESLAVAGKFWVGGLVGALVAALAIGAWRVWTLQNLLTNESSPQIVWMNVILTIFGIGGPIWFAWLSTKQISVNFKLAEDYAFKAAVSKAYEGYRKEAVEIDPALQGRLFSSALDRFEESPIRLMEKESHSSPLQELLANPAIRKSLEGIPGIADKIIALIPEKGGVAAVVGSAAAVTAAVSADTPAPPKTRTKKAEDE
ncbi:hypothetical protein ACRYWZ_01855 [Agrobacterium deltaense]|uniref:hypothetical protein n=1 Tax=Agrobacterium deltaense TaxID=1183412 RepID=UPI003D985738